MILYSIHVMNWYFFPLFRFLMKIENPICVWETDTIRCSFFGGREIKYYTIFKYQNVFLTLCLGPSTAQYLIEIGNFIYSTEKNMLGYCALGKLSSTDLKIWNYNGFIIQIAIWGQRVKSFFVKWNEIFHSFLITWVIECTWRKGWMFFFSAFLGGD